MHKLMAEVAAYTRWM